MRTDPPKCYITPNFNVVFSILEKVLLTLQEDAHYHEVPKPWCFTIESYYMLVRLVSSAR